MTVRLGNNGYPMSRRALCAGAAALALAAMLPAAGCASGKPSVSLVIKVPRTGHDVVFDESIDQIDTVISAMAEDFAQNYQAANVDVDVIVFEQNQYDEAIPGSFDTETAPDVIYGDFFNISTYIHTGRVVPLDGIITPELREDVYEYLWDISTVDGRAYMIPYLARQNVLAYNKALFEEAGLEEYIDDSRISSWTQEEWTEILDALAASLPEGSYPMMMYAGSSQGDTHIMTLLRAAGSDFFDETGHFNLSTPEGIAALQWIQDGVARGWYPPHSENLEIEDCSSLFKNGQLAIYMVNNASIGRYGDTIGLVNFPHGDGEGVATTFVSGFEVIDNGDPERLQVALDFVSFVFSSEKWLDYAAGTIPASRTVADRYGDEIVGFEMFQENADNVVNFTGNNPDTRAVREIFYQCIHDLLMGNATAEETAARIDEECNRAIDEGVAASTLHDPL